MAASLVQSKSGTTTTGTTLTITLTSPTTAGNCLVVCFGSTAASTNPNLTGITLGGAAGNFTRAKQATAAGVANADIWVDPNCAGGQTSVVLTFTAGSGGAEGIGVWVEEWSGVTAVTPVDKTNGATGTGTSWSSGSTGTLTNANEVVLGCVIAASTSLSTPGSPWTELGTLTAGTGNFVAAGWQTVSATTAQTYNSTTTGTTFWAAATVTLTETSNVSVSLPVAQVNVAAPAPGVQAGPVALPVARVNVTAYPPIPGQVFALPVAQVTVAALPPGIQRGWTLALPVAQVAVAARPPAPSVNVAVALTPAQVNVAALPPKVARQLLISLASASGTDDYGTAFPRGILATAGVIEGPVLVGSDAFFYSPSPGFGNLTQSITEADGTDQYGNAYIAGTATYTDNGSFWSAVVIAGGVVTWYMATGPGGPWTSEAGIGFSWNNITGGGLEFTAPAGSDMSGDLNVSGSITVTTTLTVAGTDVGATLSAIHAALSGASTSTNGLADGTIHGTSGGASAGTAHTHGPGSFAVGSGLHSHTLPTF